MADAKAGDVTKLPDLAPTLALIKEARKVRGTKGTRSSHPWPPNVQRAVGKLMKKAPRGSAHVILHQLGVGINAYNWPIVRDILGLRKRDKPTKKRDYKAERRRAKAKGLQLRPVSLSAGRASVNGQESLVLHTPDGYQIEGSLESVAALFKYLKGAD